jgi:hypothetical protein
MGSKALKYSAVLIGTYLLVSRASSAGLLITKAGSAGTGFAKALQGR